jgi:hypothetical protein
MQWDFKGTGIAAGEGIAYGVIDKVLKDQDATATPAPRTDPIKCWSGYFRIGTAIVSGVVQAAMPKYKEFAAPITGASFAFLTQSVWAYANARGMGNRVTYIPQRTGAPARRVAGQMGGFAQEGVMNDEVLV